MLPLLILRITPDGIINLLIAIGVIIAWLMIGLVIYDWAERKYKLRKK
jgi:hypothetical protein